jgi:hypothetical protein
VSPVSQVSSFGLALASMFLMYARCNLGVVLLFARNYRGKLGGLPFLFFWGGGGGDTVNGRQNGMCS